jgi:anti-anti-sigma regulatory factor
MSDQAPEIGVGSAAGGLYLAVNERATQRVCSTADRLVSDYLATRKTNPNVTVDLTGCAWVDSTFAGWLIGLRERLQRTAGGSLHLVGCSQRCQASLEKMHIAGLFEFAAAEPPEHVRPVPCGGSDRPDRDMLEIMARAHEELAAIDEQNRAVFAPIAEHLRLQLE